MTLRLVANPVDLGKPPSEPICRSAEDPALPCPFAGSCHETRQRTHHYANLRGDGCSFFQQKSEILELTTPGVVNGRQSEIAP